MSPWLVPTNCRVPTHKQYSASDKRCRPVECVVIHYTAGRDRLLYPRVKRWAQLPTEINDASTHLVISRQPALQPTLQLAGLDCRTWHAGGSVYAGFKGVNAFSIGVDVDNVGWLLRKGGVWCNAYGETYNGPAPYVDSEGVGWEPYRDESVRELLRVIYLLLQEFPHLQSQPQRFVGHENIRTTKRDPGRAFDTVWPMLRDVVCNGQLPTGLMEV